MKVARKVQFKTNEICVGDQITVRLSGFGKFTATAQRVADKEFFSCLTRLSLGIR